MSALSSSPQNAVVLESDLSEAEKTAAQQVLEIYKVLSNCFKFRNEYSAYDPLTNNIVTLHVKYLFFCRRSTTSLHISAGDIHYRSSI